MPFRRGICRPATAAPNACGKPATGAWPVPGNATLPKPLGFANTTPPGARACPNKEHAINPKPRRTFITQQYYFLTGLVGRGFKLVRGVPVGAAMVPADLSYSAMMSRVISIVFDANNTGVCWLDMSSTSA